MYHYSICTIADEVIFQKQCRALETHLPHLVKDELLEDVDGSLMQRYWLDGKMIRVYNPNALRSPSGVLYPNHLLFLQSLRSYLFGSCLFMNNRRLGSCRQKYEIYRENRQIALKKEQGSRF